MSVAAIVLAGGRSTRFGRDKLAASLDGRTVLAAAIDAVVAVADEVLVVGPAVPDDVVVRPTLRLVVEREPLGGPLAALAAGLDATTAELALVLGGDMPRLQPAVLRAMLAALRAEPTTGAVLLGRPSAAGSATAAAGPRQTLPLALRVGRARAALSDASVATNRPLRDLLDRLATLELPPTAWLPLDPQAESLTDVDTPDDLERLADRHLR